MESRIVGQVDEFEKQFKAGVGRAVDDIKKKAEAEAKKKAEEASIKAQQEAEAAAKQKALDDLANFGDATRSNEPEDWAMTAEKAKKLEEMGFKGFEAKRNEADAFHGKIEINGRKYGIVECSYEIRQECDATGKPCGRCSTIAITFTMPATSNDDTFFYQWMCDLTGVYDGMFTFVVWSRQNRRVYKNIFFKDAYCISLRDYFNDSDSKLMYTTVTIVADLILIGGTEAGGAFFNKDWKSKSKK